MRKLLYFVGFGAIAGSMYFYLKQQLKLALQYEYNIKKWKILNFNTEFAEVEFVISLTNKSSFEIEILGYDLAILYKNINIARAFSTENTIIKANGVVDVKTTATITFADLKQALLPFVQSVLQKKPIEIGIDGYVKVKFIGLNHTIEFNKDKFQYSANLLEEYGLNDDWEKLKEKYKFLKKI